MKLHRHNPDFPIAVDQHAKDAARLPSRPANDEPGLVANGLSEALLVSIAKREIAATRLW